MRDLGCDLSGHRPRHVSDFQHLTFDFVAKMDTPDIRKVREMLLERVRRLVAGE